MNRYESKKEGGTVYKVRVKRARKNRVKTLYFTTYESACEYCAQAGVNIKQIKVGGKI